MVHAQEHRDKGGNWPKELKRLRRERKAKEEKRFSETTLPGEASLKADEDDKREKAATRSRLYVFVRSASKRITTR